MRHFLSKDATFGVIAMSAPKFWTAGRQASFRTMRDCRALCRGVDKHERWGIECLMYDLRAKGIPDSAIRLLIAKAINKIRPWRMTDMTLKRAFLATDNRATERRSRRIRQGGIERTNLQCPSISCSGNTFLKRD